MKRIVVTGGSGFIGKHLVTALATVRNREIVSLGRSGPRSPVPGVRYLVCDTFNSTALKNALHNCDVVFHLASSTVPGTAEAGRLGDLCDNVGGTINLLELCAALAVKKFVFISSGGTVYGLPRQLPISEEHATNPLCSFGVSKLASEKYLQVFNKLYGLDYVIVRPSNVYGEYQHPVAPFGFVYTALARTLDGAPLTVMGDGSVTRDYLYVSDLVRAILRLAVVDSREKVFNVGSGIGTTLLDMLALVNKTTQRELDVRFEPQRAIDVPANILCTDRVRRVVGWRPEVTLEEGVQRTWAAMLSLWTNSERLPPRGLTGATVRHAR